MHQYARRAGTWTISMLLFLLAGATATAQTPSPTPSSDSVAARLTDVERLASILQGLTVNGWVQAEWQQFDQGTDQGGRAIFADQRRNLFTIRRARLRLQHTISKLAGYSFQINGNETGVSLVDAYVYAQPFSTDQLTITLGQQNRPNGEVIRSSAFRESIERAQVVRALYPNERDLGLVIGVHQEVLPGFAPQLQVGLFNGVGIAAETDPYKDIVARLVLPVMSAKESPVKLDIGGSIYHGGVPQASDTVLQSRNNEIDTVLSPRQGNNPGWGNRQNFNIEAEARMDLTSLGTTTVRGEYITGRRPVMEGRTGSQLLHVRNLSGFYAYFVQNIGTWGQVAAKYEGYDRNTDLAGSAVRAAADLGYTVLGFGVNIFVDKARFTLWYEMPHTATGELPLADGTAPDITDNKTTVRFQYRW